MAASKVDEIHAASEIKEVDLVKLRVDYSYQRDPSENLVDEISNDWDAVAAELLTVSNRGVRPKDGEVEGGLWIVNGQHRAKAAQKKGMEKIWARVIDLRKEADPAAIEARFRLKTNRKLSDRPLERFKAQLRANDEESLAIVKIFARFKSEINIVPAPDTGVNCVSTIEALYRMDGGGLLTETLEVVNDTWGFVGGKNSKADLLKGICWFIEKHADESDRDRLVSKLKGIGLNTLESRARTMALTMSGALWINYYRSIVDLYNENLKEKNRLQWMLRGKSALGKTGRESK